MTDSIIISDAEKRQNMREEIKREAGDSEAILGTVADGLLFLLYEIGLALNAFTSAQNDAERHSAFDQLQVKLSPIVEAVKNGECRLPYLFKGESEAIQEILTRSDSVTAVMEKYTQQS